MTYSMDPTVPSGDVNALIADYEGWLHSRAHAMTDQDAHDDLVQEGRIAVWQAAQSFQEGRGALPHWLTFKAENRMKTVLDRDTWTGRPERADGIRSTVTEKGQETRQRILDFIRSYQAEFQAPPSQAAIARGLKLSQATVSNHMKNLTALKRDTVSTQSLDALLDAEHGAEFLLTAADLVDSVMIAYHRGEIARALDSLTPAQKKYVLLRFWSGMQTGDLTREFGYDPSGLWNNSRSGARVKLREALAHLA